MTPYFGKWESLETMFNNYLFNKHLMRACLAAVFALGLAACSSSSDQATAPDPTPPPVDPAPTAYETALANIQAADTAEAAQAAYDAVNPNEITAQEAMSLMDALNERVAMILADTAYARGKAAIMAAATAADAQAAYDMVDQTAITGEEAMSLQTALNERLATLAAAGREAAQKMALMNAAEMIDTSDLSTAEAIADANTAIGMLQAALDAADDVDAAEKAMYQTQLDNATEAVRVAQSGLDKEGRMTAQRMAISNAVTMARTAVAGVNDDSTDSEVAAADSAIAALKKAIEDAVDLDVGDDDVASAQGTLATLEPQLAAAKRSRMAAIEKRGEERDAEMAATGMALHAALAGPNPATQNALNNIDVTTTPETDLSDGLSIDAVAGAGTLPDATNPDAEVLEAVEGSDTSLGTWMGMDYAHSEGTGTSKVTNEARVYTNQGPAMQVAFGKATNPAHTVIAAGDPNAGRVLVEVANLNLVMADAFLHSATLTHPLDAVDNTVSPSVALFRTRGTYDGAPGWYRCTGATACTSSNDGKGSPSALGGVWHFEPDATAMVSRPDEHYLYYGWWVSKDDEGMPTAASAFMGRAGTDAAGDGLDLALAGTALTGTATYEGNAVGKFAVSNPLDGTGNGGHFTADAELKATFGAVATVEGSGITGTIDNFRLNDGSEDPGWSVSLHRADWGATGAFATPTADDAATVGVDETMGTTWSINDNPASRSGTWSGQMYDGKPGLTTDDPAGDGSTLPTTVTGTFYSEFSTIGRMVGAFGADVR